MNCPSCNAQVPQDATACPGCGAPITPAAAAAAPAAAPQDAQKKPGFDIKAVSSQLSANPVVKKYGVFIAAGVVVLLVLIICLIACSGGGVSSDTELVTGLGYMAFSVDRDMTCGSDKEAERLQKKAFEYLKKSAKHGNIEAMYYVAEYYLNKEEDEAQALKWAEKAEKKGSKAGKELAKKLRKEKKEDAD